MTENPFTGPPLTSRPQLAEAPRKCPGCARDGFDKLTTAGGVTVDWKLVEARPALQCGYCGHIWYYR